MRHDQVRILRRVVDQRVVELSAVPDLDGGLRTLDNTLVINDEVIANETYVVLP